MKKALVFAIASCLLMSSVAFAFDGKVLNGEKTSIEQMAKKKKPKPKS